MATTGSQQIKQRLIWRGYGQDNYCQSRSLFFVGEELGVSSKVIPEKVTTIAEGEGLLNDTFRLSVLVITEWQVALSVQLNSHLGQEKKGPPRWWEVIHDPRGHKRPGSAKLFTRVMVCPLMSGRCVRPGSSPSSFVGWIDAWIFCHLSFHLVNIYELPLIISSLSISFV